MTDSDRIARRIALQRSLDADVDYEMRGRIGDARLASVLANATVIADGSFDAAGHHRAWRRIAVLALAQLEREAEDEPA